MKPWMRYGMMEIDTLANVYYDDYIHRSDNYGKNMFDVFQEVSEFLDTRVLYSFQFSNVDSILFQYSDEIRQQLNDLKSHHQKVLSLYGDPLFAELVITKFRRLYEELRNDSLSDNKQNRDRYKPKEFEQGLKFILSNPSVIKIPEVLDYFNLELDELPNVKHQILPLLTQFETLGRTRETEYEQLTFKAYDEVFKHLRQGYDLIHTSVGALLTSLENEI